MDQTKKEACEIVAAWTGTDPMRSRAEVREALVCLASGGDIAKKDVDRLLPAVCEEAAPRRLLIEDGRPTRRVYVAGRELALPSDITGQEAHARFLEAGMVGQAPGTPGRIDLFTYPYRRGAHAYRTEMSLSIDSAGVPIRASAP